MLYVSAVVLLVLWMLGMVTNSTMGGLIHILLVIAIVMMLVNFISGRRRLTGLDSAARPRSESKPH